MAIRASLATSGRGSGLSIIDSELTNDSASDKALKIFEESVEVVNGYGFTESNIFMDPGLVKKYQVVDGAQVKGTAVINYNKNKGTWGWKVLLLDTL